MELKKIQEDITQIFLKNLKRDKLKISEEQLFIKLTEELGEFSQSYLVYKKMCRPIKRLPTKESKKEMSKELADLLGILLVITKMLKIDPEEALVKKWITREWINE